LDFFTYIHQDHKDLVPKVDAMIKKMKANGEMKALVKKAEAQVIENILK